MSIVDDLRDAWVSASEVLDLYFDRTRTYPVEISESEACETAHYDAKCTNIENEGRGKKRRVPLGKLVL